MGAATTSRAAKTPSRAWSISCWRRGRPCLTGWQRKSLWCHTGRSCWKFTLQNWLEIYLLECWRKPFMERCRAGSILPQNCLSEVSGRCWHWVLLTTMHCESQAPGIGWALWGANWVTGPGERSILEPGREASTFRRLSSVLCWQS